MKLWKKSLALLLAVTMMLPLLGVTSFAADPQEPPIDYVFETVPEEAVNMSAEKLSYDLFSSLQWDMKMIGMEEGWASGLTGKGVKVGIVDSGLSNLTFDIDRDRILKGKNLSPIKLNIGSPVMDTVGHGTFIAGIIGATKGNGVGIAGMAPGVTIAPIKCFSTLFSTPDAEIEGIYAAVDEYGCDVINLSSGTPDYNAKLKKAVDYAASNGAIVISTVGNEGDDTLNYPGACESVIAVGSVDKNMNVSEFSNKNESVFVVAPGEDVISLGTMPLSIKKSSGTSFSAPFVSGLAVMLRERYPQMTTEDFKEILKASSKDLGEPGYDTSYGWGLVQVPQAIEAAAAYFGPVAPVEPEPIDPALTDEPDPSLPIDQQFTPVDSAVMDANAPKLSFDALSALQWDMKMIGMREAWNSGLTGNGVRVGIIDTGVLTNSQDIDAARLLAGKNLVDENESTNDTNGHGTFVAGIIGATKGNGVGIAGVAPEVTIVPLKTSTDGKSNTSINAQAVYAAVDEFHCDVINFSTGSLNGSPTLQEAIRYAYSKGVIVVCSTGNDGTEAVHYPGGYAETIGVGFVGVTKKVSSLSHHNETIDVVAPGEGVVSLSKVPLIAQISGGSSYAAPFVSGLAALLKQQYPQMNKDDFLEILKMSSEDLGDEGYDTYYGWGLLNVPAAIRAAAEYFGGEAPDMPDPQPSLIDFFKDVLSGSWFYKVIDYVTGKGYMRGMSADTFAPEGLVTRAQVAQILYNMEGKPSFLQSGSFSDTPRDEWFFTPVMWAESAGLVKGFPDGSYQPNAPVTREQLATILHRYAAWKHLAVNAGANALSRFADCTLVSDFALTAMQWATTVGVLRGDDIGRLNPTGTATRAEVAAMLMNFDQYRK